MVTTQKREAFEKNSAETKSPAVLNLQIWDNDSFSSDDFLGTLSINLSHFPTPATSSDKCSLKNTKQLENLFALTESIRGWFPTYGKANESGSIEQTVS